jgi:sigma-B regulation protein RsbU (phosphoserine phosphatase)
VRTPPRILIVDDTPENLDIFRTRLSIHGYEILTADNGEEGLALAREEQADLILLDVMMPKMDGFEVCRRLRADPAVPFMPIILVTAKADSKDIVAGLEAGGDEYLTKPVDQAALVARVKSMLRIKALHDTVVEQSAQLKVQLETATKIQSLFWPKIPELGAGGHIWAVCVPATYLSGDLYDVIPLRDDSLLAYVADVSGKGVPAALVMAALSTKIRSEALLESEVDKLLQTVNNSTYSLTSEEGFFATIVLARYWPSSGKMQFTVGGHLQPLWIVGGNIKKLPQLDGISLGLMPHAEYQRKEILLSPGESILFFSDGVIEAENENYKLFGHDRLINYIKTTKGPPWGKGLLERVQHWLGNSRQNDDLTILEIWREQNEAVQTSSSI